MKALTDLEQAVLLAIAEGGTDHTIRRQFGLTRWSAAAAIRRVNNKLGAHHRAHAVAIGIAHGLIQLPDQNANPKEDQ